MYSKLKENGYIIPPEYCYFRSRLSPQEQQAYDLICRAVSRYESSVELPACPGMDISHLIRAIQNDQSLLYYVDRNGIRWTTGGEKRVVKWQFLLSWAETQAMNRRLLARLEELKLPDKGTELAREVRIHDRLLDMGIHTVPDIWQSHCLVGPLLTGGGVCEGVSHLFRLMCLLCGVHCICIHGAGVHDGDAGSHMWNLVKLGDTYAHVDAYWDCLEYDGKNGRAYTYLNLSDRAAMLDHVWETVYYPTCLKEKYSYFAMNRAQADSVDAFRARALSVLDRGGRVVCARLGEGVEKQACVDEMLGLLRGRKPVGVSYVFNEKQRVLRVWVREEA